MVVQEPDRRLAIWMRMRPAGERLADPAREYGYADGSGILRVVQRINQAAGRDASLRSRLERARETARKSRLQS